MTRGFTLIEILIAVAVALTLSGMGYVVFIQYSQSQTLNASYSSLYNNLNEARSLALSQVKPSTCVSPNTLVGYQVNFDLSASPQKYKLESVCSDAAGVLTYTATKADIILPGDVTVDANPNAILFLLSGDASLPEDVVESGAYISLTNFYSSKSLVVESSGSIVGSQRGD